jgi:hypothetical protein
VSNYLARVTVSDLAGRLGWSREKVFLLLFLQRKKVLLFLKAGINGCGAFSLHG